MRPETKDKSDSSHIYSVRRMRTESLTNGYRLSSDSNTTNSEDHSRDMNVAKNPRPCKNFKYPCGVCSHSVSSNHRGIQCDTCDYWFHIKCANVSPSFYNSLNKYSSWSCSKCTLLDCGSDISDSEELVTDSNSESSDESPYNPPLTSIMLERGAYWPIFHKAARQVAKVKPFQHQVRPERDVKAAHVPCLMSHAMLGPLCSKAGYKFNSEPCYPSKEVGQTRQTRQSDKKEALQEEYEIEEILDHKLVKGKTMYYIKWKDWDSQFNTWEPKANLLNSHKTLQEYRSKRGYIKRLKMIYGGSYLSVMERKLKVLEIIRNACDHRDLATIQKLYGNNVTQLSDRKNMLKEVRRDLLYAVEQLGKPRKPNSTSVLDFIDNERNFKHLVVFAKKRLDVLYNLKQWESDINSHVGVIAPVRVENDFDLEGPPKDFTFIIDYQAVPGIVINDDPPVGCECTTGCYENRKSCCPSMSKCAFAFNRASTLTILPGNAIYECNKKCLCGPDCPNRVVQKGSTIPLAIFRTDNGRGWGVKTLERIKKGTFVLEYIGQIVTSDEAEKRGKIYDAEGSTYLFDLDFDGYSEYMIDAGQYGNVAHFINHSCAPNLVVMVVWINNLDRNLPRIAFFTNQDIRRGEELTFDYRAGTAGPTTSDEPMSPPHKSRLGGFTSEDDCPSPSKKQKVELNENSSNVSKIRTLKCKCGAKECRKIVF